MMKALYQNHAARESIAGTVESISHITAQTLYDCHKAFYTPSNMILTVVGNVDPIHVVDLARGHVAACNYLMDHAGCEVFNLGTGTGYSVLDLVNTFQRVNDIQIPYAIVDRRPGDVARCYADATKARELLGWKAEKTLEDMCRDAWNWQKNNPDGYHTVK